MTTIADRSAPPGAHYTSLARLFHWTTALFVVTMIPAGIYMTMRAAETSFDATTGLIYDSHKLGGFIVFWIAVARVGYRLASGGLPPEASLTEGQRTASFLVHTALYGLIILVPLTGWLGVSAFPAVSIFGLFELPRLLGTNPDLAKQIFQVHKLMAIALGVLVLVHVGAALYHALVRRDGVFQRMWPAAKRG
jgi:cytochrome b561